MRTTHPLLCLSLVLGLAGGCRAGSAQQATAADSGAGTARAAVGTQDDAEAAGELVRGTVAFGFRLLQQIRATEDAGDNVFISPFSVAMALAMAYNGAAGATAAAMQETLGLQELAREEVNAGYRRLLDRLVQLDPAVEFLPANSIWYRAGIDLETDFLEVNRRYFDAEITGLDFDRPDAAPTINRWVEEKTKGLIEQIVQPPIDPLMMLYLINAIYFKGDWTVPFNPELTLPRPFNLADGTQVTVPTMAYASTAPVGHYRAEGLEAVDLSYGDSAFSMTILLPERPGAIHELARSLTVERWDSIVAGLAPRRLEVQMPKFTLEYELALNDVLKALGMAVAFQPGRADFSRIAPTTPPLYISEVKHKTYVDVNEQGTEAAAVTGVGVRVTSLPQRIIVDRPFVFAIRERSSGAILFLGVMMDPR